MTGTTNKSNAQGALGRSPARSVESSGRNGCKVATPKRCPDCVAEGITTRRKPATDRNGFTVPAGRCSTHHRARRAKTRSTAWESRLMKNFGITAEQYWKLYEYQNGRCYLCQRASGRTKRLAVDHDHSTGLVRGLLCSHDNLKVVGHSRDSVEFFQRGIDYLTNPPAFAVIGKVVAPIELDIPPKEGT